MEKIISDDLYRYEGKRSISTLYRYLMLTPGFRYIFFFRKTQLAKFKISRLFWQILLRQCMLRTGIQIPTRTKIANGFRIVHFGHIIINPATKIGKNFNIYPGVTIGHSEGKKFGSPTIGNNVCVFTNAVIVGGVKIGNDVVIAPNSFVNFDVPDDAIVIGNPGQILQRKKPSAIHIVYSVE